MRRGPADIYDEDRVAVISRDVAAAIDAATFGSGSWDEIPAVLSSAFPGSWGGLYNMNFPESRLNFLSFRNMEPAFVKAYEDHFAYVNPWGAYWTSLKTSAIAVSEDVFPARRFAKTEFYNDWLRPQNDAEAAVGMKIVGERDEAVHVLLHHPLSLSEKYDRAAAEIFRRVRGNLERSVALARLLRAGAEGAVAEAALVARGRCAAFVVDGSRLVREANPAAMRLFSSGGSLKVRNDRCFLSDHEADNRFWSVLQALSRDIPIDGPAISFRTTEGTWQLAMAALPAGPPASTGVLSLLPPHRMVLVLASDLSLKSGERADLSSLSTMFGLTPSEISFCRRLVLGDSVAEAADQLGITVETARTRLKAIFHKTGTSRQGQLMLLLSRLV